MITEEHIQIYRKYDGDIDWWSRVGYLETDMTEDEWFEIQNLLQKIHVMNAKLTSKEFDTNLVKELHDKTDGQKTIKAMLNYQKTQGKK